MIDINSPSFNPGGLRHQSKPTDFDWSQIGSVLPPYNWDQGYDVRDELKTILGSSFKLPIKNQFQSGSCGGQAYAEEDQVLEAIATKSFEERSAKFIIAQTFITDENGIMLGSNMVDNASLLVKQGVAREIICPSYQGGITTDDFMNRPQDITEEARADAKSSKAKSYLFVKSGIDNFAQAVAFNHGLVMIIRGENNGTWLSTRPKPPVKAQWGHFMYLAAPEIINGVKGIWAQQSWGEDVGEGGWQFFTEDYFKSGFIEFGQTFVFDSAIPIPPKYIFTRDLYFGKTGLDVRFLQRFLNTHGCPVALIGPGSLDNETSNFGELTREAVIKFQKDHWIKPSLGYFGPITRNKVNLM